MDHVPHRSHLHRPDTDPRAGASWVAGETRASRGGVVSRLGVCGGVKTERGWFSGESCRRWGKGIGTKDASSNQGHRYEWSKKLVAPGITTIGTRMLLGFPPFFWLVELRQRGQS